MPRQFSHVYFLTKGKYEVGRVLLLSLLAIAVSVAAIPQASSHLLGHSQLMKIENSALAEHSISFVHRISWSDARVLIKKNRWSQRRWEEAWEIAATDKVIANRDRGRTLPSSYLPLVKKYTWLNCLGMTYGLVYSVLSPPFLFISEYFYVLSLFYS